MIPKITHMKKVTHLLYLKTFWFVNIYRTSFGKEFVMATFAFLVYNLKNK